MRTHIWITKTEGIEVLVLVLRGAAWFRKDNLLQAIYQKEKLCCFSFAKIILFVGFEFVAKLLYFFLKNVCPFF
jgi:hypothetical protein